MDLYEKESLFNSLVLEWNKKINLVSRKRTNVYDLIEDSKLFFKYINFSIPPAILDLGTGGGFPGIVLKIHHPEIHLTLLDSVRKKIKAVTDIVQRLGLEDVEIICSRAEDLSGKFHHFYDYVIARSVADLKSLVKWSSDLLKPSGKLLTLKGGWELKQEAFDFQKMKLLKKISIFNEKDKKALVIEF